MVGQLDEAVKVSMEGTVKKVLIILIIMVIPGAGYAAGYVLGSYGSGGTVGEISYGMEMGGIFLSELHPRGGAFSFGLGVSVADTDDGMPGLPLLPGGGTLLYLKEYDDGNEQSVYAIGGMEFVTAFFGVAGIGYASQDVMQYGLSSSGWYMLESSTEHEPAYMVGVRYIRQWLGLGLGYDSRRGIVAHAGIGF